ncbi:ABC transporter substrate-binding protein [Thalassorhabdomicrobium marinisediminis]|uniref:Thiamine pyrimidine synthase n=1 Tax=Thalassorhabdomicrobium marinisediminis TaxID=2170577 RepID=A0A2T7FWS3_9RHOB|nr:ABC transporter substrate-binding protein [Thalassorhabdomicrobium marinisediminis]PVA06616.1 hypothetical protein DC363_08770 [Thalassorhabdomicrobium marinisediminis]
MKNVTTIAASVLAVLATSGAAQDDELESVSLRLPWILNVQAAGYVMALDQGYYEDAGLDVEILPGGPNLNSTALVATGSNTFGTHDISGLLLGAAQGMDIVMVGACFQDHPGGVITLASKGIETPNDLVGQRLAYNEGGPWVLVQAMLAREGVSLDDIELVVSPSTELLINRNVDAKTGFTVNEPIAVELAGIETNVILPSNFGVNTNAEVIFTTRDFMEQNPDTVQGFVDATVRGYAYAYEHPDETVEAVLKMNDQLEPEQQAEQLRRQESYVFNEFTRENGPCAFDTGVVADTMAVLKEFTDFDADLDPDSLYSTEFVPTK